MKQLKMHRF